MHRLLNRLRLVICVFCGIRGVRPVHAAVTHAAPPASIASQPTSVAGQPAPYIEYDMTAPEEAMLRENGFVVLTGARHTSLWAAYPPQVHVSNLFVTTDAMLELWYSLHRDLLKTVEKGRLLPDLEGIVAGLARSGAILRPTVRRDVRAQTALHEVMVTLKTAERLLDVRSRPDSDARVNARVDLLVRLIMAHNEMRFYPDEDYTQYTVRGYYAADPDLARYFRASLWLSRRLYAVSPADDGDPDSPLRAAVAFAAVLRAAPEEVRERLMALNRLRQSLAGPPDSISVSELGTALDHAVGSSWTLTDAMRPRALARLRHELARPSYPISKIVTRLTTGPGQFPTRSVVLLPGIVMPDCALFQQTMHPRIWGRSLARGIEVGAALGSSTARRILREMEGARASQVLAAIDRYGARMAQDDGHTVYSAWLHALATLPQVPANAPAFMRHAAWQAAKLDTLQASWAQLRHNYLLYSNQPVAMYSMAVDPAPALVEANPDCYHALAQLATRTRNLLATARLHAARADRMLAAYAAKCREFEAEANAELAGKLTLQQSESIDKFGEWLIQFPNTDSGLVADVATGSRGDVLHVATGQLDTILVMPDPGTGKVYAGATLSYYEFIRRTPDRMTDAMWKTLQTDDFLHPERPAWTAAYAAPEEAMEEWALRAPLRQAEGWMAEGRGDAGLDLLRRTVAANPDTTLATEAQYRIGRYLYDGKRLEDAEQELRRCRSLPGCDAYDRARSLLWQIGIDRERQDYRDHQLPVQQRQRAAGYRQLQAGITALRRGPISPDRERQLAIRLLHDLPWALNPFEVVYNATDAWTLLNAAARQIHAPACRHALGYAALIAGEGIHYSAEEADLTLRAALDYLHSDAPTPLRAGALGVALDRGYLSGKPDAAMREIKPFLRPDLFQTPPGDALRLLMTARGRQRIFSSELLADPFARSIRPVRNAIVHRALNAGQVQEAFDLQDLFPREVDQDFDGLDMDVYFKLRQILTDAQLPAMSLLLAANSLREQNRWTEANAKWMALAEGYPRSVLAPLALGNVASTGTRASMRHLVDRAKKDLLKTYPDSYPALCLQLTVAVERGDTERAPGLLPRCVRARDALPLEIRIFFIGDDNLALIVRRLGEYNRVRAALRPLLDAAADPTLDTIPMLVSDGNALADRLLRALPGHEPDVYLALASAFHSASMARRFIERFPDHPRAAEAWSQLDGDRMGGAFDLRFPESARWLAPFIDRGPDYPHRNVATTLLMRELAGNPNRGAGLNAVDRRTRLVSKLFPASRIRQVADASRLAALLDADRPEAALQGVGDVLASLPDEDPVHAMALELQERARARIAAKHVRQ